MLVKASLYTEITSALSLLGVGAAAVGVGSVIEEVIKKGPSDNILKKGDVIIMVDGEDVKMKLLATEIAKRKPFTDITFTVVRDNDLMNVTVKLGKK